LLTGSITCRVYATSAGVPTTVLATSDAFDLSTLTAGSAVDATFVFSGANNIPLVAGTKYAFILYSPVSFGAYVISFTASSSSVYSGGGFLTADSALSWYETTTSDAALKIYLQNPVYQNTTLTWTPTPKWRFGTAYNTVYGGTTSVYTLMKVNGVLYVAAMDQMK
jgi:hypothetical protein